MFAIGRSGLQPADQRRIEKICEWEPTLVSGQRVIRNVGLFVDTHRDMPHIGSFYPDIHRGMSHPLMVDYFPDDQLLFDPASGQTLILHHKHMFLDPDWYGEMVLERMMVLGESPISDEGEIPTRFLRDPRTKPPIYALRSFRYMIVKRHQELAKIHMAAKSPRP